VRWGSGVSRGRFCVVGSVACPELAGNCVRGSTPRGVTGFGTPPAMLGAVCVGVVPPGVTAFGAGPGAGVVCENAGGALTQVRAKANIVIFLMISSLI